MFGELHIMENNHLITHTPENEVQIKFVPILNGTHSCKIYLIPASL